MRLDDLLAYEPAASTFDAGEWYLLFYGAGSFPKQPILMAPVTHAWTHDGVATMRWEWHAPAPVYIERVRVMRAVEAPDGGYRMYAEHFFNADVPIGLVIQHDWDGTDWAFTGGRAFLS